MYKKVFQFGTEITSRTFFNQETGYGFIDCHHVPGVTKAEKSLHAGGWNLRKTSKTECDNHLEDYAYGVRTRSPHHVIIFKTNVPQEGSFSVKIKIKADKETIQNMKIFCGRRNLVAQGIQLSPGEEYQKSFITYISPYIPALTSIPNTEKAIYISISGLNAGIQEITIEETTAPTIFIAGDSTLTDQNAFYPYYASKSCGGWAQMLLQYFEHVGICNQAHSGMTTNCFRDDGHWQIISSRLKEGDFVMLQFGHNDQKRRNLAAFGGYINNLRWYVKEIRKKGAYPIIISPISRVPFLDNGKWRSLLSCYALACRTAADELEVPFIDLHEYTFETWKRLGESKTHNYFMPGDITHTNDYGANLIAARVVSEIERLDMHHIGQCTIDSELVNYEPFDNIQDLPSEEASDFDALTIPYVDIDGIPQYEYMVKALHSGLLDPCVMHLHPFDPMPRAQFLMVYFKALRMSGKRPYLGAFCDISRYEWDSAYVQAAIDENLIDSETVTNELFRADESLTQLEYASFLVRGMQSSKEQRHISLDVCYNTAKEEGFLSQDNSNPHTAICRADCYTGLVKLMDKLQTGQLALPKDTEIHPVG